MTTIATGQATSRAGIARVTGLARSTVGNQVEYLLRRGLFVETETDEVARGRPPRMLGISPEAGTLAVADVYTQATKIAIADLNQELIDHSQVDAPVGDGPETVLTAIVDGIRTLLRDNGRDPARLRQLVVGLPGPVDFHHGCAVRPPIMPGWDGFPVSTHLSEKLHAPVVVDNDVNLAALGEVSANPASSTPLLFIRIASGIGAGLVTADGTIHRGANGAAGDIGHIPTAGHEDMLCSCGKTGCIEAVASFSAILRDLHLSETSEDYTGGPHTLSRRLAHGDAAAMHRIRNAAAEIGRVVAMLVHIYNPRTLVLGGPLAEIRDELLSGVRAVVFREALPLATRKLVITTSELGSMAGITGGITQAFRDVFSPPGINQLLHDHKPSQRADHRRS